MIYFCQKVLAAWFIDLVGLYLIFAVVGSFMMWDLSMFNPSTWEPWVGYTFRGIYALFMMYGVGKVICN